MKKLIAVALVAASCAGMNAGKGGGAFSNGNFTPGKPAATNYGPDATRTCMRSSVITLVNDGVGEAAKTSGKPAPAVDPRLCAVAETFLAWEDTPPPDVTGFVGAYFGLPNARLSVSVATMTATVAANSEGGAEAEKEMAANLIAPIIAFAGKAPTPRYAVATQYVNKTQTKVVLVQQDQSLDLQPLPRKLAPGATAPLAGKVTGDYTNLKVQISDPQGGLQEIPVSGDSFQGELKCADKTGLYRVLVRGERSGAGSDLGNFAVACGVDLPASVAAAAPTAPKTAEEGAARKPEEPAGPAQSPEEQEKKVLEMINAERTQAGLKPLELDPAVSAVARAISEKKGEISGADLTAALKQNQVASPLVEVNPAQGISGTDAHKVFETQPAARAKYMSKEATHAGLSVVLSKDDKGRQTAFLTEVFVKELAKVDLASTKAKLLERIAEKRKAAKVAPIKSDPTLDEVAQKYAEELVKAKGNLSNEKDREVMRPLYKSFGTVDYVPGVKPDPLDMADEPTAVRKDKLIGVGLAQGDSATFGKNAVFVVIIVGSKK